MIAIRRRASSPATADLPSTLHPVVRRIYLQRGLTAASELPLELSLLAPPAPLRGLAAATAELAGALARQEKIVVVGDYDADGATGAALAVLVLRAFGADVDYLVPSRFSQGYGLSPPLADAAAGMGARLLLTVDNGIASVAGVARARELGLRTVITDHHLAGPELPAAEAIVNPNQPGCAFPSKHLSGVGVMFYVLSALRGALREAGHFRERPEPKLAHYLDLVAVGTVADMVRLDRNNRILVSQGLDRIRAGHARPGILALLQVAGRDRASASAADVGFSIGPRLNAAGRMDDMALGIECLLATDPARALEIARQLDSINRDRREVEGQMREEALAMIGSLDSAAVGVCLFDPGWHEGVVGLVASKLKDRLHRPTIALARAQEAGMLKGSCRSIPGLHIRDALAAVDARRPGLLLRYGGHAMAAGLTLREADLGEFSQRFDAVCRDALDPSALEQVLDSDGELGPGELGLETARALERAGPWGQGFPEPLFDGRFEVRQSRVMAERHARYRLECGGVAIEAIDFGGAERRVERGPVELAYRLQVSRWQGAETPELRVELLRAG